MSQIWMNFKKTGLLFRLVNFIECTSDSYPERVLGTRASFFISSSAFKAVHAFLNSFKTLSVIGVATCRRCCCRRDFLWVPCGEPSWTRRVLDECVGQQRRWCATLAAGLRGKTLRKMKVCSRVFLSTAVWRGSRGSCGSPAGRQISLAQECLLQVSRAPAEGRVWSRANEGKGERETENNREFPERHSPAGSCDTSGTRQLVPGVKFAL